MKTSLLLLSVGLLAGSAQAQVLNSETINHNNASAIISDEGLFFNNSTQSVAGYEIPSGSGKTTVYAMSPWIGALDANGQLHLSGNSYGASNFHSGPIADPMHYGTNTYEALYQNAVWSVTDAEIQTHATDYNLPGYTTPSSILNWPGNGDVSLGVAAQLAPYIDLDNDGVYEPQDGEYPEIRGDKAVYVIMNDESFQPSGTQLGVELHFMFFQIASGNYMNNTTFMHLEVFNRSTASYFDYTQTFFVDFDLGNYSDDYVGCDTIANVGYVYNGDSNDEDAGGALGYGIDPPCQGLTVLSHDMSAFGYYTNASAYPHDDPSTPAEFWYHMNATYSDGSPWMNPITNTPTNFMFSGNPSDTSALAWSEQNNGSGMNPPSDRRVTVTINESQLPSGASICSEYAWVYDKAGDRLANVNNVINISNSLQTLYDLAEGTFMCNSTSTASLNETETVEFTMYPNPSSGQVTLSLPITESAINIQVIDVTGRVIIDKEYQNTSEVQLNLSGATGLYLVKTSVGNKSSIQRLICN